MLMFHKEIRAQMSDCNDSLKEKETVFMGHVQEVLESIKMMSKAKIEKFKSTLMSSVELYYDFEKDIIHFIEDCSQASSLTKAKVVSGSSDNSPEESKAIDSIDLHQSYLFKRKSNKFRQEDLDQILNEVRNFGK